MRTQYMTLLTTSLPQLSGQSVQPVSGRSWVRLPLGLKKLFFCIFRLENASSLYTSVYPYISYAIVAWGSAFKSNLKKLQVKQNHIARTIFFATLYGKDTESALPLLNLLDILTIENTFKFQAFNFIHNWHIKKLPSIFTNSFTYAKDIHSYNTR